MNSPQVLRCVFPLLLSLHVTGFAAAADRGSPLVFIHNSPGALESIELKQVADLYLGRTTKIGGITLEPVLYDASHPLRAVFHRQILKEDPHEFAEHWRKIQFLGGNQRPPRTFRSVEAVLKYVQKTRGAFALVPAEDLGTRDIQKVDRVDGAAVEDSGYPLLQEP